MLETLKNAWKVAEIRKKLLYTLFMLLVFRLLCFIPTPGVTDSLLENIRTTIDNYSLLGFMQSMTGSDLASYNIMAMGITPYINSVSYTHLDVYKRQEPHRALQGARREQRLRHRRLCAHYGNPPAVQGQALAPG